MHVMLPLSARLFINMQLQSPYMMGNKQSSAAYYMDQWKEAPKPMEDARHTQLPK